MNRSIRQTISYLLASLVALALIACQPAQQAQAPERSPDAQLLESPLPSATLTLGPELSASPAELPPLPYDYAALEPYIDAETMRLHHDNHHAAYVKNLNGALQQHQDLQSQGVAALLQSLDNIPEDIRTTVRNNAGGHLNHTLFWQSMAPNAGGAPTGALAEAINQTFGSFDSFKQQFNQAGGDRFGSGWVWLVRNPQGQLQIVTTPNQDNPIQEGLYPIMGNDVWEHAYYLNYQNRRAEYLENWWNVVNWVEIDRRFAAATGSNA